MHNGSVFGAKARICLGVCTFQRPLLLGVCLNSLMQLSIPEVCELDIVIVDNNARPDEEWVTQAHQCAGARVHYVHEPRRGIAQARNAILDKALALKADWIAMVDDDQTVPHDWLEMMWRGYEVTFADVVRSSVEFDYPDPLPVWAATQSKPHRWKFRTHHAATNGVLFRRRLIAPDGWALRFSEEHALTGGEDRDFFERAYRRGALIVVTPNAVAREFVPETKLTFSAQVWRSYWIAAVNTRDDRRFYGFAYTIIGKTAKVAGCITSGLYHAAISVPTALGDRALGRHHLLKGAKRVTQAAGILVGLIGLARPEPYRTIHGN